MIKWSKINQRTGKPAKGNCNSFEPHDYKSDVGSILIINNSFSKAKDGWVVTQNNSELKSFNTLKAAKAYAETLVESTVKTVNTFDNRIELCTKDIKKFESILFNKQKTLKKKLDKCVKLGVTDPEHHDKFNKTITNSDQYLAICGWEATFEQIKATQKRLDESQFYLDKWSNHKASGVEPTVEPTNFSFYEAQAQQKSSELSEKSQSGEKFSYKGKSLQELKEIAKQLGVDYKEYSDDKITRMRLVMSIKAQKGE